MTTGKLINNILLSSYKRNQQLLPALSLNKNIPDYDMESQPRIIESNIKIENNKNNKNNDDIRKKDLLNQQKLLLLLNQL